MVYFSKGEAIKDEAGRYLATAAEDITLRGKLNPSMFIDFDPEKRRAISAACVRKVLHG